MKMDDIVGAYVGSQIICTGCLEEDWSELAEEDLILKEDTIKGDNLYICDRCNKPL